MPLEAIVPMMRRAAEGGYAVGYFESWNLESLQGVVDAAEQSRAPVILGFNGDFLSRPTRRSAERLSWYAALGKAAAESASVPCGLIFNECPLDDWVRSAVSAGFNLVMPADPGAPHAEYVSRVAELTRLAHSRGVAVEAEVGELPCGTSGGAPSGGAATDPGAASAFVEATGVDLLAVSVGNVHVRVEGRGGIDLDLLREIRRRVPVPLALHGGTGVDDDALREAVALGVAKVNYGTYLKQRYLRAVREAIGRECPDPHRLLGVGGPEDLLVAGRLAVRDAVLERIGLLGCVGRAGNPASRTRDVPMRMPDLAATESAVRVVRWLAEVGRPVRRGQALLEVETDKAVMEVESTVTGTLRSVAVPAGREAAAGQVIAVFEAEAGTDIPALLPQAAAAPRARPREEPVAVAQAEPATERVSFFARNRQARGSGRGVLAPPEVIPLSAAGRTVAGRMSRSKREVPHFYLQTSADAGPMLARRAAGPGRPLVWDAFFVHAAGKALARFGRMCYRFEDDRLVSQRADAVAVAVDLDGELFAVPVDGPAGKTPEAISDEIRAAVGRLRGGDPSARVTRRADLTVTNLGVAGIEAFAAVITPPESSALAVGRVRPAVVAVDGRAEVRDRVTLTLSVDHRVVNGRYAADFLNAIVGELESF